MEIPGGEFNDLQYRLARRILDHARWHELEPGARLAEPQLAALCGVSRSPVRSALRLLAAHGFVEHHPNRGFFLKHGGWTLDPGDLAILMSDGEALYRRILSDRFGGALPDTLTTSDLQRRYATSRASIARVMSYMRAEGLIEPREGHGWQFRPALISRESYDASYRFRLLIEPAAFHEPAFAPDMTALGRLMRAHRYLLEGRIGTASYTLLYDVDAVFHESIAAWSGNIFLQRSVREQNRVRRLTEYEFYADRARMRESTWEHLAILEAVAHADHARASDLMARHIAASWGLSPAFPDAGD